MPEDAVIELAQAMVDSLAVGTGILDRFCIGMSRRPQRDDGMRYQHECRQSDIYDSFHLLPPIRNLDVQSGHLGRDDRLPVAILELNLGAALLQQASADTHEPRADLKPP
jgi:hypothetical protein